MRCKLETLFQKDILDLRGLWSRGGGVNIPSRMKRFYLLSFHSLYKIAVASIALKYYIHAEPNVQYSLAWYCRVPHGYGQCSSCYFPGWCVGVCCPPLLTHLLTYCHMSPQHNISHHNILISKYTI